MNDMNELVLDFLQDIYYAERAGTRALTKMARAAEADALKALLTEHRKLSETQVSRLEDVFGTLKERPKAKQCAAMDGLIHEAEDCIHDSDKGPVLDAALIACAQAMDHYEIARYGALIAWMGTMGNEAGVEILRGILAEEKEADARFNELALADVNPAANEETPEAEAPEPEAEPKPEPPRAKAPKKAAGKAPAKPAKAKAASTPRGKKAAPDAPEPEAPELAPEPAPEPADDEPEAPEPAEMATTPAPAAKRKGPARKKAAAAEPEPEPEIAEPEPEPEPEPAPAAKPKRGRGRAKG